MMRGVLYTSYDEGVYCTPVMMRGVLYTSNVWVVMWEETETLDDEIHVFFRLTCFFVASFCAAGLLP